MIEILPLGGFAEVGRNCTAVKVDDEVIILDLGLKMEEYVAYTEDEDIVNISGKQLIAANAVPDITRLGDWKHKVKAIILGHAHLDHIGAVPFLAKQLKAPIYGSPYTIAVMKSILKDHKINIPNKLITKQIGTTFRISKKIEIAFENMNHSIPDAILTQIITPYGDVLYANDFKIDRTPTIGVPFSGRGIRNLKPKAIIMDSLYADNEAKTPSEGVARSMLLDLFRSHDFSGKAVFVTTFASHIARLKTIVEVAKKIKRKPVFLGRSLAKYAEAAKSVGMDYFRDVIIVKYGAKVRNFLMKNKDPEKYLYIVTGHQGEPKAVLSKLVEYYPLEPEDTVVFSCTVIPTEITKRNRIELETKLKEKKMRIFKDVHVSGHGSREDIREFVKMMDPEMIISSHAAPHQMEAMKSLALEMGFENNQIKLVQNGELIKLDG